MYRPLLAIFPKKRYIKQNNPAKRTPDKQPGIKAILKEWKLNKVIPGAKLRTRLKAKLKFKIKPLRKVKRR